MKDKIDNSTGNVWILIIVLILGIFLFTAGIIFKVKYLDIDYNNELQSNSMKYYPLTTSKEVDKTLFEILIVAGGSMFSSTLLIVIFNSYNLFLFLKRKEISKIIVNEGIVDVFDDANDGRLIEFLRNKINESQYSFFASGLGVGILANNPHLLKVLIKKIQDKKGYKATIFVGSPNNKGLLNRVEEEKEAHRKMNKRYDETWPKEFYTEISCYINDLSHESEKKRFVLKHAKFCPMYQLIKIDNYYFLSLYGTPNIRGPVGAKSGPWIAIKERHKGIISMFLNHNIDYYDQEHSSAL